MNLSSSLVVAAALFTLPGHSSAADTALSVAHAATMQEEGNSEDFIKRGDAKDFVIDTLGVPHARLSADIWVYWDYKSTDGSVNRRGYDTLLITFTDDCVSSLKLVNGEPVRKRLAAGKRPTSQSHAAAKP